MDWRDHGILLSARPHGESAAIVEVFTVGHGRHLGVVRGGASRRQAAVLQPGSRVAMDWRARLDEHIGAAVIEPTFRVKRTNGRAGRRFMMRAW